MQGSCRGIFPEGLRKIKTTSVKISGVPVEIQTDNLPKISIDLTPRPTCSVFIYICVCVCGLVDIISRYFPGGKDDNHEKLQPK